MTDKTVNKKASEVWEEIEGARCTQRYTQKEIAQKAGIAPTVYSEIKNGTRNLTLRLALRLLDALGLKIQVVPKR